MRLGGARGKEWRDGKWTGSLVGELKEGERLGKGKGGLYWTIKSKWILNK